LATSGSPPGPDAEETAARTGAGGSGLAGKVYEQILAIIARTELSIGDRLPSEHSLAGWCTVSRAVVREALIRLQADGIVETRRGSGSYLRRPPGELQIRRLGHTPVARRLDVLALRFTLEPAAARLAAQHVVEEQILAMREALTVPAPPAGSLHRLIASAAGNPLFRITLEAVALESSVAGGAAARALTPEACATIEREHAAIVEAIASGDPDQAEAAMRLHLSKARQRILAAG
jgi:DNA-binding FadR family transcriptional regulator